MARIQVGNGWLDLDKGKYTTYDPNTGQIRTLIISDPQTHQNLMQLQRTGQLQNVNWQQLIGEAFVPAGNRLGGRGDVNVQRQIYEGAKRIRAQYPQMTQESALKYANKWVSDRIAMGWDSNEVEDLMKGVGRGDNDMGDEFLKGVVGDINFDESQATPGDATGTGVNPQQSIQDELRAFAGQMMQTVGPDSPQAKRIAELASAAGNKYATSSGMGPGGITARGVAATAARAHTDLQTQRESIGLSALAAAGNQQITVDAAKTALQQQQQQAGVLNSAGIGGLIGSGVGLVGGIVGSAATYGAMTPAIPGLIQAGGAAGQGIGGIVGNGQQGPINYGGQQAPSSGFTGRNWGTS